MIIDRASRGSSGNGSIYESAYTMQMLKCSACGSGVLGGAGYRPDKLVGEVRRGVGAITQRPAFLEYRQSFLTT